MPALRQAREIQHRRNEHKPAHADALVLFKCALDLQRAHAAVTLADEEFRRAPAAVLVDPFANEDGERIGVPVDRPDVAPRLVAADQPAVARPGRIDENEICEIKPGLRIGNERCGPRCGDATNELRQGPSPPILR